MHHHKRSEETKFVKHLRLRYKYANVPGWQFITFKYCVSASPLPWTQIQCFRDMSFIYISLHTTFDQLAALTWEYSSTWNGRQKDMYPQYVQISWFAFELVCNCRAENNNVFVFLTTNFGHLGSFLVLQKKHFQNNLAWCTVDRMWAVYEHNRGNVWCKSMEPHHVSMIS